MMCIFMQGFCVEDDCNIARVSYGVYDEFGSLNSPSWCSWIVPGTITDD